jgi:hypothetical protein
MSGHCEERRHGSPKALDRNDEEQAGLAVPAFVRTVDGYGCSVWGRRIRCGAAENAPPRKTPTLVPLSGS